MVHGSPRDELYALVKKLQAGELDVQAFCGAFERVYNLELDKSELSPSEAAVFAELFDRVVWFSPYPDEREEIPNYIGEEEVEAAVRDASGQLRKGAAG